VAGLAQQVLAMQAVGWGLKVLWVMGMVQASTAVQQYHKTGDSKRFSMC
jgi:hypothetical protein